MTTPSRGLHFSIIINQPRDCISRGNFFICQRKSFAAPNSSLYQLINYDLIIFLIFRLYRFDLDLKVLNLIEKAGTEIGSLEESSSFKSISFSDLKILAKSDQYAAIVLQALELNRDTELPLYDHQFKALCALAELKDVLLIFPCGSGKSRVMNNGPAVVKLGFAKLRNEGWLMDNLPSGDQPLCIISCPLFYHGGKDSWSIGE